MENTKHPTTRERRTGERNVWRMGFMLSLLAHLLIFVLWPTDTSPPSPHAAAGPRAADPTATGGAVEAVQIQPERPRPVVPPPIPTPAVEPVDPVDFDEAPSVDPSETLGERPVAEAPGADDRGGEGDAGTADEGRFRSVPPSPRGMILPPSNRDLRGTEVEVWVFVNEEGRVVPDSTRLEPPTRDGEFNRRLVREAAEWVFEPARQGGEPVAAWFPYTITM